MNWNVALQLLFTTYCLWNVSNVLCSSIDVTHFPSEFDELTNENGDIPEGATTLAFVFDVTGSMYDDLVQVIEGAARILEAVLQRRERLLHNYVLVPFHDPEVGNVTITTDHVIFQERLKDLYVQGGGDCPEASIAAIKMALEIGLPNSFIYVFTDASSKDYYLLPEVLTLIQRKQSQVVFVMTGNCEDTDGPGYLAYETIASTSSGQVFHLKKSDVDEVLNFVRVSLQARKVNLLAVNQKEEGEAVWPLVVDSKLREFTVSLSGDNPKVELIDPAGESLNDTDDISELLNIPNVKVVNVKDPDSGTWNVKFSSNSSHTVRATGLSPVDFVYGFSVMPTSNLKETYHRPLKGVSTYLIINATDLPERSYFSSVELVSLDGKPLSQVPIEAMSMPGMFNATPFIPPDDYFYLKIHGFDEFNYPMERISPTAISAQLPGVPEITLHSPTDSHHGNNITLICQIQSLVPFSSLWAKGAHGEHQIGATEDHSQTSTITLRLENISSKDEDNYFCNATNIAGSVSSKIFLDVRDPPPQMQALKNVAIPPDTSSVFHCSASSASPFNLTWSRYDSRSTKRRFTTELIKSNPRFTDFGNGTLAIRNSQRIDEGWYRCTARNEGGPSHRRMYLSIQKSPTIKITPGEELNYVQGTSLTILCESSGIPDPTIEWIHNGQLVVSSNHIRSSGGTLLLHYATKQQEGSYICRAQNAAGSNNRTVNLNYIEPPRIDKSQSIYKVISGEILTLPCVIQSGTPATQVQWQRKGEIIPKRNTQSISNIGRGDLPVDDEDYNSELLDDRFQLLKDMRLRFRADSDDAGEFWCEARNEAGVDRHEITVIVIVPPAILSPLEDTVTVRSGETLTLTCWTEGQPTPTVSWLKDGIPAHFNKDFSISHTKTGRDIAPTDQPVFFTIPDIDLSSAGLYTCIATNDGGSAMFNYTVIVHDAPKIEDKNVTVVEGVKGHNITIPCQTRGYPPPVISWKKNRVELDPSTVLVHQNGSMTLSSLKSTDEGIYTCTASNTAGYDQKDINVTIIVEPVFNKSLATSFDVLEGNSATLQCPIETYPIPKIEWYKEGKLIKEKFSNNNRLFIRNSGLSLIILRTELSDSGSYVCEATNAAGKGQSTLSLNVSAPPKFQYDDYNSNVVAFKDGLLELDCEVTGVPLPRITWTRNNQQLQLDAHDSKTSYKLTIPKVQERHAGTYACNVVNKAGSVQRNFNVTVFVPPKIDGSEKETVLVRLGQNSELSCEATGSPLPSITWFKNGNLMDPKANLNAQLTDFNRTLTLSNVSKNDAGQYTCKVDNVAGFVVKHIHLEVLEGPLIKIVGIEHHRPHKALHGTDLNIDCIATGNPVPNIVWHKGNTPIYDPSKGYQRLHLPSVGLVDGGQYTCVASNIVGRADHFIVIEVLVPPSIEGYTDDDSLKVYEAVENLPAVLHCPAIGKPPPTIKWFRNGIPLSTVSFNNIHILDGGKRLKILPTADDGGDYKCIATNDGGQAKQEFQLKIVVPPVIDVPSVKDPENDPSNIKVDMNKQLKIHCPAVGNPQPEITWLKDGVLINSEHLPNVEFFSNSSTLIIHNAQENDSGRYTCIATNIAGSHEKDFHVNVLVPPRFTIPVTEMNLSPVVLSNRPVTLDCPIDGYPPPAITWMKDDKIIESATSRNIGLSNDRRKLKIHRTRPEDSGLYSCEAHNEAGRTKLDINLEVHTPPRMLEGKGPLKIKAKENESIAIECPASGHPIPTVIWLKDGYSVITANLNLSFDNNNYKLVFNRLQSINSGQYTCVASNEAGSTEMTFEVDVQVPPILDRNELNTKPNVMVHRPLTIVCPVNGNPLPVVKWFKNGVAISRLGDPNIFLSVDGRRLTLRRSTPDDSGIYTCIAFNEVGKTQQDFNLTVQVPPRFQVDKNDANDSGISEILAGTTGELQCEVIGTPEPVVIWLKDGQVLDILRHSDSSSDERYYDKPERFEDIKVQYQNHIEIMYNGRLLRIQNIRVDDSGRYTCIASNAAGTAEKNFDVEILVPPKISGLKVENSQVLVNRPLNLECPVDSYPPSTITWFKGNVPLNTQGDKFIRLLNDGKQLHVPRAIQEDSGKYTCIATNSVGEDEKHFNITVLVPPTISAPNTHVSVNEREDVVLECYASGNPPPVMIWLIEGTIITDHELFKMNLNYDLNKQRLIINGANQSLHSGRYTCMASNEAGAIEKDINLEIISPPSMMNLPSNQRSLSAMNNQAVRIVCPVISKDRNEIEWFKDGQKLDVATNPFIHISSDRKVIRLTRVQEDDKGRYRCFASNVAGHAHSDFDLQILVPPKFESLGDDSGENFVMENHDVDFQCYASGNPSPTLSWFKDGKVLQENTFKNGSQAYENPGNLQFLHANQHLRIPKARVTDAGHYSCIATSSSGTRQRDFYLTVQVPPKIDPSSVRNIDVNLHHAIHLHCPLLNGTPDPSRTWFKHGIPVESLADPNIEVINKGQTVHIQRARLTDSGKYVCVASNSGGNDNITVTVDVHVPPSIDRSNFGGPISVIENQTLVLECPFNGYPKPNVAWYKEQQVLRDLSEFTNQKLALEESHKEQILNTTHVQMLYGSQTLQINAVELGDKGSYECVGSNSAGQDHLKHEVDVIVPPRVNSSMMNGKYQVIEGESFTIRCPVYGVPTPHIVWFKGGQMFSSEQDPDWEEPPNLKTVIQEPHIQFIKVQRSDSGRYICLATNKGGDTEAVIDLEVLVPPNIEATPEKNNVDVVEGHSVSLECKPHGNPFPDIEWQEDENGILNSADDQLKNKHFLHNNQRLRIENVKFQNRGRYTCVATNSVGVARHQFMLQVIVPPRVNNTDMKFKTLTKLNDDALLECHVTGIPQPRILWYKESQMILAGGHVTISNNGTKLLLSRVRLSDTGQYTCVATNDGGTTETEMELEVLVPPTIDGENGEPELHTVVVYQPIVFECHVRGTPKPNVVWYKNDGVLPLPDLTGHITLSKDGHALEIARVTLQDEDIYSCLAENEAGITEKEFKLDVLVPPGVNVPQLVSSLTVIDGQPVTLKCPVTGDPMPTITWFKRGQPLLPSPHLSILNNGEVIHVESVLPEHDGEYICLATNEAGKYEQEFIVQVIVPPRIIGNNYFTNISVIAYHPLTLECPTTGKPSPEIQWQKDSQILNSSTNVNASDILYKIMGTNLQMRRILPSQSGLYVCEATNVAGSARKYFNVNVLWPPTFANNSIVHQEISHLINDNITLSCSVKGNPPPRVSWYKDDQLMLSKLTSMDEQELHLFNAEVTDSGNYQCVATNLAGNASKKFTVDVLEPPRIKNALDESVKVTVGDRVDLTCHASGSPSPQIQWSRNGHIFQDTSADHLQTLGSILTFPSVRLQDESKYQCTATNDAGVARHNITLIVQVPPTISDGPLDISVIQGLNVTLPCHVQGRPLPNITWIKDSEIINYKQGNSILSDGSLSLNNVHVEQAGLYTCLAQNSVGSKEAKRHLRVNIPPSIMLPNQQQIVDTIQGQDVILKCLSNGHPKPQTIWERNGQVIDLLQNNYVILPDGSLKLYAAKSSDTGNYRCLVQNVAGSDFKDVTLNVMIPPKIESKRMNDKYSFINGSSPLQLPCTATGYPLPSIKWYKDGVQIPTTTSGNFYVNLVTVKDAGKYVCMATNDAGQDHKDITIEVYVPPTIIISPEDQEISLGSKAQMVCRAEGVPTPSLTWLQNGVPLLGLVTNGDGKSTLTIEMVQIKDSGIYTCVASNLGGVITAEATLNILIKPKIIQPPGDHVLLRGSSILLPCVAEGDPYPYIFWTKNGQRLESPNSISDEGWLNLKNVQPSDSGVYKCTTTNKAGIAEATSLVNVLSEPVLSIKPYDIALGASTMLDCKPDGNPLPHVIWTKDGNPPSEMDKRVLHLKNNSLHLTAVQIGDEGAYNCTAINNLGSVSSLVTVLIRVDGSWSSWSKWGVCSSTCGQGFQVRERSCNNPTPRNGGQVCLGIRSETRVCDAKPCPIDGSWSDWDTWTKCSVTCNRGTRLRTRNCSSPQPSYGGKMCPGNSQDLEACFQTECPVDGGWGMWTEWSACSTTCGKGVRKRTRLCNNPQPQFGGLECRGIATETNICNNKGCEIHGQWGSWSLWTTCSQSCGGGTRERFRLCNSPAPSNGGRDCNGQKNQIDYCNHDPCPIHGNWGTWSSWGACSVSCSGGQRRRFRACNNPSPSHGGRSCAGPGQDTESCNAHHCPEDGSWAPWSPWSYCSASCGSGIRQRHRSCTNPPPRYGGRRCVGDELQIEQCSAQACNGFPLTSVGNLLGAINGQDIGLSSISVNATKYNNTHAVISATIDNVPPEVGNWLRVLPSMLSPIYWSFAQEIGQAVNGYTLTKGYFQRETQVSFSTGEVVKMTHVASGLDGSGAFLVDVVVTGDVPDFPEDEEIALDKYTEDYIQTGPDSLHAISTRTFRVSDYTLPYAWNHSIQYDEANGRMPYLVQQLHVDDLNVNYDLQNEKLSFTVSADISKGSPSNKCPKGFNLHSDGTFCNDVNECLLANICSHKCMNTFGSFQCSCPPGYTLGPDGHNCQDLDECLLGMDDCSTMSECENTIGSFQCIASCAPGFKRSKTGLSCQDINECAEQPEVCDQLCLNLIGGYRCDCRAGYRLIGSSACRDIDECEMAGNECSDGCVNTLGSFICTCPEGYSLVNERHCEDINECWNGKHNCRSQQQCLNIPGSFKCADFCSKGFTLHNNGSCVDLDECRMGPTMCHLSQLCENTPGSYRCFCPRGFQSAGPGLPCQDYNECEVEGRCQHKCTNTLGSYKCNCPSGYKINSNGRTCRDVDECVEEGIECGKDNACFNTRGSFKCINITCPPLFDRDPLTKDCLLPCDRSDVPCPPGVKYAEILSYKMVSLPSGIQPYQDLVRLVAYDQDGQMMEDTEFVVIENSSGVPFQIRQENGKGHLYALKALDPGQEYSAVILAASFDADRTIVYYTTKFIVYISVAEYPY